MKHLARGLLLLSILCIAAPLSAQEEDTRYSTTTGLMLGVSLNGTAVENDDNDDIESGSGFGLSVGYGFNPVITAYVNVSAALIEGSFSDGDFTMVHLDLGARFNMRNETKKLRPFIKAGYSGVAAVFPDVLPSDLTTSGSGGYLGGGIGMFLGQRMSLDVGFTWLGGSFTEAEYQGDTESIDLGITTTRFDVGATWYLGGGE